MSNYPSAPDPDPVPYVPAWFDSTPPQGSPIPLAPPPADDGGRGRRRERERSVLLSPLVIGLVVLLAGVLAGGAYLYVNGGEEKKPYSEGSCLDDLAGNMPHVVECGTPEAKYQIISVIPGTIDTEQCASMTGADIPMIVGNGEKKELLCVMDLAR